MTRAKCNGKGRQAEVPKALKRYRQPQNPDPSPKCPSVRGMIVANRRLGGNGARFYGEYPEHWTAPRR